MDDTGVTDILVDPDGNGAPDEDDSDDEDATLAAVTEESHRDRTLTPDNSMALAAAMPRAGPGREAPFGTFGSR